LPLPTVRPRDGLGDTTSPNWIVFNNCILDVDEWLVLHGKVVDENGEPVHGAVVTNMTNYFLYGDLQCRTDTDGRFTMPDLSFRSQKIAAQYGERAGEERFDFDAGNKECLITVRPIPKSGSRNAPVPPRRAVSLQTRATPPEGMWNLNPPTKEPKYQSEPRYALLVFGPRIGASVTSTEQTAAFFFWPADKLRSGVSACLARSKSAKSRSRCCINRSSLTS
jgi:hypothetical protein